MPITFCHRKNLGKRISTDFNVLKYLHFFLCDNFLWAVRIIIVLIFKCKLSQAKFVLESFRLIENFLQQFIHTTDSAFTFHVHSLRTVWRSSRTLLSNPLCNDWMLKENVLIPKWRLTLCTANISNQFFNSCHCL